jgi:hypothetical protein
MEQVLGQPGLIAVAKTKQNKTERVVAHLRISKWASLER